MKITTWNYHLYRIWRILNDISWMYKWQVVRKLKTPKARNNHPSWPCLLAPQSHWGRQLFDGDARANFDAKTMSHLLLKYVNGTPENSDAALQIGLDAALCHFFACRMGIRHTHTYTHTHVYTVFISYIHRNISICAHKDDKVHGIFHNELPWWETIRIATDVGFGYLPSWMPHHSKMVGVD